MDKLKPGISESKTFPSVDGEKSTKDIIETWSYVEQEKIEKYLIDNPEHNRIKIYVSALPFCAIKNILVNQTKILHPNLPTDKKNSIAELAFSFSSNAHEIIQNMIIRDNSIYGNYECQLCKNVSKEITNLPSSCKKCGCTLFNYKEVKLEHKIKNNLGKEIVVVIKVDGLKLENNKEFTLLDYKFVGEWEFNKTNSHKDISKKYIHQMNSLLALLNTKKIRKKLPYRVTGYELIYMNKQVGMSRFFKRENIKIFSKKPKKLLITSALEWLEQQMTHASYGAQFLENIFPSDEPSKKLRNKSLNRLVKQKPCNNEAFYRNNFETHFDKCPIGESGLCFTESKNLKKYLLSLVQEKINEEKNKKIRLIKKRKKKKSESSTVQKK